MLFHMIVFDASVIQAVILLSAVHSVNVVVDVVVVAVRDSAHVRPKRFDNSGVLQRSKK